MRRFASFLCAGLLVGLLAPLVAAQTPVVEPERFGCIRSALAALPRLIEDLKSPDEKVRSRAVATLGNIGPHAIAAAPALVEHAVNNRGHAATLKALVAIDGESTRAALRRLLAGGVGRCRCGNSFINVVAEAGEPIVPHLLAIASEPGFATNVELTLVQIGEPALPHLIRSLDNANPAVRLTAFRTLGQFGSKAKSATSALESRLAIEKGSLQLQVALALSKVTGSHQAALDVLHSAVRGSDTALRVEALQCLRQARTNAKELIPTMVTLVLASDGLHYQAAEVLGNIGRDSTPALLAAMSKADAGQKIRLVHALRLLGVHAGDAVPALVKLLQGDDPALALLVVQSLPDLGPAAKQAIPQLLIALKADNLVYASAAAIARIDAAQIPHTIEPLATIVRTAHGDMQTQALYLLNSFGPQARPAARTLVALLKTEKLPERIRIASVLAHIDPSQTEAAVPTWIEAMQQPSSELAYDALDTVADLGQRADFAIPTVKAMLRRSLRNNDGNPRMVIRALQEIGGGAEIMPILIEALNSEDRMVRNRVTLCIGRMNSAAALPAVETALTNGQLRSSPEVVALVKRLRQQSSATSQ